MKHSLFAAALTALVVGAALAPSASIAQDHDRDSRDYNWNGDRNSDWDPSGHYREGRYEERRMRREDRIYRGGDGRYYCRRSDGTTGLVVGAIGGGLLGGAIGGDALGALVGAGSGALIGDSIDRGQVRCR